MKGGVGGGAGVGSGFALPEDLMGFGITGVEGGGAHFSVS
jgi:hypothetical protein